MGYSVFPAPSSGITVSDGNTAGWNRTNPAGLTLVASTTFASLTGTNTYTISSLSGYSFYRLVVAGYYNAVQLRMRLNGNADARYDTVGIFNASNAFRDERKTSWVINLSNGVEYNSSIVEIDDANSANYKVADTKGITVGTVLHTTHSLWTKAEAISSITLFTNGGANFTNAGYDGAGIYLYGGY